MLRILIKTQISIFQANCHEGIRYGRTKHHQHFVQAIQCPAPGHRGNVLQGNGSGKGTTFALMPVKSNLSRVYIYKQDIIAE